MTETDVTVLVRSRRGDTYHRRGCYRAHNALPWFWAEGKTRDEVEAAETLGVRACRICDPLGVLPVALVGWVS